MYDKQIESLSTNNDESYPSVPRNVFNNNNSDQFQTLYQAAILTSKCVDYDEDKRLELAFDEKEPDTSKVIFLTKFANFGITKLLDLVGDDELSTMENLKNFLTSTMEGTNLDIEDIDSLVMELE